MVDIRLMTRYSNHIKHERLMNTPFSLSFLYIKQERGRSERAARVPVWRREYPASANHL